MKIDGNIYEKILINLLSIDKLFKDYEFIHCYIGPKTFKQAASKIEPKKALENIKDIYKNISEIPNSYPFYRQTFIKDLLKSAITQADFFYNNQQYDFRTLIQDLVGTEILPPFNLDDEFRKTIRFVDSMGYSTIGEFLKDRRKIEFSSIKKLEDYIYNYIDDIAAKMKIIYSDNSLNPGKSMNNMNLKVEESTIPHLPCYYFYKGKNKGVVGITMKKELSDSYLKGFILHEILPGHHFYYLMKQKDIDAEKNTDVVSYIDLFYSPENTVNEGLAVNGETILGYLLDKETMVLNKVEKFVHNILYNAWYSVNIEHNVNTLQYVNVLQDCCGFNSESANQKIKYYVELEKHYVASYPIGSFCIKRILDQIGLENVHKLYTQHSLNTLNLLVQEESKCQKRQNSLLTSTF